MNLLAHPLLIRDRVRRLRQCVSPTKPWYRASKDAWYVEFNGKQVRLAKGSDEPAARDLAELLARLERATAIDSLLGLEGQGAALYFGEFNRFLKAQPPGRGFDFKSRNRCPPRDPVNALLSFAYAMLLKDCFSALCIVGFHPYRGFFHTGRHGKPSLALDLMEEFRAVIADSVVLTLVNNRILEPGDFLTWREACQLTEEGRRKFSAAYEQRRATVVTHPLFGYKISYSRMMEVQARLLAAYVRGDVPAIHGLHGALKGFRHGQLHRGVGYFALETAAEGGDNVRGLRRAAAVFSLPLPLEHDGLRAAAQSAL
jgi:hypothetical protein